MHVWSGEDSQYIILMPKNHGPSAVLSPGASIAIYFGPFTFKRQTVERAVSKASLTRVYHYKKLDCEIKYIHLAAYMEDSL